MDPPLNPTILVFRKVKTFPNLGVIGWNFDNIGAEQSGYRIRSIEHVLAQI